MQWTKKNDTEHSPENEPNFGTVQIITATLTYGHFMKTGRQYISKEDRYWLKYMYSLYLM